MPVIPEPRGPRQAADVTDWAPEQAEDGSQKEKIASVPKR